MTYDDYCFWERLYEQDPWGELRQDWRAVAVLMQQYDPDTNVSLQWPYFDSEERDNAELEDLNKRQAEALADMDAIEARLRKARELHYAAKAQKQNG